MNVAPSISSPLPAPEGRLSVRITIEKAPHLQVEVPGSAILHEDKKLKVVQLNVKSNRTTIRMKYSYLELKNVEFLIPLRNSRRAW